LLPDLTPWQWALAVVAASGIGFSKSGFAGFGLFHIVVFADMFGARPSTGILLPMLIVGDLTAVATFRRHARWDYIRRILPPALIGIVAGWWALDNLNEAATQRTIGLIILLLAVLQAARMWRPQWFTHIPHAKWFAWALGFAAGSTTMIANGAGPIVAIYLIAVSLPKYEFVGTSAWFFLIINLIKVPFSIELGLIRPDTLLLNLVFAPSVVVGLYVGKALVQYVPQRLFDSLLLMFAAVAGLRMVGVL
jgi:uncharacterized membrane protein YfcA